MIRRHAPMAAVLAVIRRHAPMAAVLAVGVALRVVAMVAYRPALLYFGDSFSYLDNALRLQPGLVRPIGYPLFLRVLPLHHLTFVVAANHLLGLGVGVLIYILLRRLGVGGWLAALGAAPVLLDAYQINIEQYVMAEALFEALIVGALVLLLWKGTASLPALVGSGILLAFATLTRTAGVVAVVVVVVYTVVRRIGLRRVAVLLAAVAVPVVSYALWFQSVHGKFAIEDRDGFFLYGRVATFADCTGLQMPSLEQILCDARPTQERPNANFYLWNASSPIHFLHAPRGLTWNGTLLDFSKRVIRHQPATYAAVVLRDIAHYFSPGRPIRAFDSSESPWRFRTVPVDTVRVAVGAERFGTRLSLGNPTVSHGPASFLVGYQRFGYSPGPFLGVLLALGIAGAAALPRRKRLRAESLLFAAIGVGLLAAPAATAMFDYRYLLPSIPLLSAGGALGLNALIDRVRQRRAPERGSVSASPEGLRPELVDQG